MKITISKEFFQPFGPAHIIGFILGTIPWGFLIWGPLVIVQMFGIALLIPPAYIAVKGSTKSKSSIKSEC